MQERLQKILSRFGVASRRKAEELILNKKVLVNNKIAKLGQKVDLKKDIVEVKHRSLSAEAGNFRVEAKEEQAVYYLVNKPVNFTCSVSDKHAKKLITDLVPKNPKVWPVGRLDKNSTGLIILTNDGNLTNKLTHPKFKHEKEYEVAVDKKISEKFLQKMKKGIKLDEGVAKADKIIALNKNKFIIILHQGWKRQIRRMCEKLNYKVLELKRTRIGKIKLKDLKEGKFEEIKKPLDVN